MAAPLTRCDECQSPLSQNEIAVCEECNPSDLGSLLDDPEVVECSNCNCQVHIDELSEDDLCPECVEGEEDLRQQMSDYRHSVL